MEWWKRLWRSSEKPPTSDVLGCIHLALPEWTEVTPTKGMRVWRDSDGDVLSLANSSAPFPDSDRADEAKVRKWCRGLAQSSGGGLIEAHKLDIGIKLIYKRLDMPAYIYTGMLITHVRASWLIWTMVAGERGTTGVREAVVTANLINEGKLKPEEYELRWGQDPYDPAYRSSVDRSVLRFISDDECYDEQFRQHPLSKVRRVLAALPGKVKCGS
jgi:hypothetical protein